MTPHITYPLTIFYDASCPVCREEIALLQRYDENANLVLEDCSPPNYAPPSGAPAGVSREAMMTLIHGKDATGQWLIGAPVFAAAYAGCGFPEFAWLWGSPKLQPFWNIAYPFIARHRMKLSKLGAGHALGWLLEKMHQRAARRAVQASATCATDSKNGRQRDCK